MNKIIKSRLFAFLLGAIIFGGIGVAASQLFASSISFTPSNPNWELEDNTVEEAINYLYENGGKTPINYSFTDLGISKNSATTITFNPGNYKYLFLMDIYWTVQGTGHYNSASNRLQIKSISNAEYKSVGITGKDGSSSSSASRSYILKVIDKNENVTITFNDEVTSLSIYGIN